MLCGAAATSRILVDGRAAFTSDVVAPPDDPGVYQASAACKEFVLARLKAPSTAKFQESYGASVTTALGSGGYRMISYVDAENAFGAPLRSSFICDVRLGTDSVQLISLAIQ